jgi:tryptophanyl-tRNA synthetase
MRKDRLAKKFQESKRRLIILSDKFYKQVNEALITLSDIRKMSDEKYTEKMYFLDSDDSKVKVWKWILVVH